MAEGSMDLPGMGVGVPAMAGDAGFAGAGGGGAAGHLSFHDILHALNPLQHLPVIGMIYRAITGDEIDPTMRIAGSLVTGFLTGGPIGALASAFGSMLGGFAENLLHHLLHGAEAPSPATVNIPNASAAPVPTGTAPALPTGAALATTSPPSIAARAAADLGPPNAAGGATAAGVGVARAGMARAGVAADNADIEAPPSQMRMGQGLAAYARAQGVSLAAGVLPRQDSPYAAQGSG